MWLYTQHGFASITRDPKEPGRFQVRGRRRPDLERLAALLDPVPEIIDTPGGDYACRFFLDPEDLTALMAAIVDALDYGNFKDRAHETLPDGVLWDVYRATTKLHD